MMSTGPLRRITGAIGLIALLPIALLLAAGSLTPEEAAVRALIVGVVTVVLGNLMRVVLSGLLARIERRASDRDEDAAERSSQSAGQASSSPSS